MDKMTEFKLWGRKLCQRAGRFGVDLLRIFSPLAFIGGASFLAFHLSEGAVVPCSVLLATSGLAARYCYKRALKDFEKISEKPWKETAHVIVACVCGCLMGTSISIGGITAIESSSYQQELYASSRQAAESDILSGAKEASYITRGHDPFWGEPVSATAHAKCFFRTPDGKQVVIWFDSQKMEGRKLETRADLTSFWEKVPPAEILTKR